MPKKVGVCPQKQNEKKKTGRNASRTQSEVLHVTRRFLSGVKARKKVSDLSR